MRSVRSWTLNPWPLAEHKHPHWICAAWEKRSRFFQYAISVIWKWVCHFVFYCIYWGPGNSCLNIYNAKVYSHGKHWSDLEIALEMKESPLLGENKQSFSFSAIWCNIYLTFGTFLLVLYTYYWDMSCCIFDVWYSVLSYNPIYTYQYINIPLNSFKTTLCSWWLSTMIHNRIQ